MKLPARSLLLTGIYVLILGCDKDNPVESKSESANIVWRKTELEIIDVYSWTSTSEGNILTGSSSGNIYKSVDDGLNWEYLNLGFGIGNVISLASLEKLSIYAGTSRGELFHSLDGGRNWSFIQIEGDLKERNEGITTLAVYTEDQFFAGTSLGSFFVVSYEPETRSWNAENKRFPNGRYLTNVLNMGGDSIIVGTREEGLFQTLSNGDSWIKINTPSTSQHVQAIVANTKEHIFVSFVNDGIYRSTDRGESWMRLDFPGQDFTDMGDNSRDHLFVGTSINGVYRSTDNGDTWRQVNDGLPTGLRIQSLAVNNNDFVLIATSDGVYRSLSRD